MLSPIEEIMADALEPACRTLGWKCERQVPFAQYTVDFLVTSTIGTRLVVECDGAQWHERDEDRGLHDRKRDRYILRSWGITTIRFLGREINENVNACIVSVLQCMARLDRASPQRAFEDGFVAGRGAAPLRRAGLVEVRRYGSEGWSPIDCPARNEQGIDACCVSSSGCSCCGYYHGDARINDVDFVECAALARRSA